ncbi:transmembrane and ubiquitin-like domain-containing protein 1 [Hyla sarda]|uniref:transmembrane and ubiquitin-like domain-containing protein 1 n=1 Tax=Hyla sarda TaxID=327740 RepID=UPI0024C2FD1C|nr:transmembrane and ubiquitin-like domain-containing protein 1 [Hyla sarda]XP_056409811.1 transmembrane and ubiquitin-like domain-containing protein 1 [Hyla sarda]
MALIEGVGDEVTLLCALLFLLSVVALAWISTHTSERGSAPWSSQIYGGRNSSGGHGPERDLRAPNDPVPEGSPTTITDGNSSTGPDLSPVEGGPSLHCTDLNDPENTGDRGPQTQAHPENTGDRGPQTQAHPENTGDRGPQTQAHPENAGDMGPQTQAHPDNTGGRGPQTQAHPDNTESPTVRNRGPQTQAHPTGSQDTITLRLKFLNETERVVNVRPTDSILHIKRSQFPGQEPCVRLIYQGQLLRDDSQTVASLQLGDGCVLHCHISQHAAASGSGGAEPSQDAVNIGSLMVPLFLLLLGALWYCHFQYPHVFNGTATAFLGAMTLFVLVLVFSSYRR